MFADEGTDTLRILDELAGNVVNLVSPQWIAPYHPTAVAIDPRRGDLWVAAVDDTDPAKPTSKVIKLQLVSGRLLQTIELSESAGATRLIGIAISPNGVYALDAFGRRIFALAPDAKSLRVHMPTYGLGTPTGLTVANDTTAFVSFATGLARLNLSTRTGVPIPAIGAIDLSGLHSIAARGATIHAIQQEKAGGLQAVRIDLDRAGRAAVKRTVLEPAGARAAALVGDRFYFLAQEETGRVLRKLAVQ